MSKTIPIWACVLNRAIHEFRLQVDCTLSLKETMYTKRASHLSSVQDTILREKVANDSLEHFTSDASCYEAFPNDNWDCSLHLPLWVSETEKENIENRMYEWVKLLIATEINLSFLAQALKKPLRPLWISQNTLIWLNEVPEVASWSFTPLILVSASQPTLVPTRMNDKAFSWNYISGAADDEESWARGLTPVLFWKHAQDLVLNGPAECNKKVANIVERERVYRACRGLEAIQVKVKSLRVTTRDDREGSLDANQVVDKVSDFEDVVTSFTEAEEKVCGIISQQQLRQFSGLHWIGETRLAVGNAACGEANNLFEFVDCAINCGVTPTHIPGQSLRSYLYLPVVTPKFDRFSLQKHLPVAVTFARERLKEGQTVLIFCIDGEDASVCICLAILLSLYDAQGQFDDGDNYVKRAISKWDVRQCLVYVCNYLANARPCRGSLRQVFNFLTKETISVL